ncbi:MAG: SprT family zinc-dependent metalloprotease [Bauldia sp.]
MNFLFRKPQPPVTQHFEVATDRGPVSVSLRRDTRARNYTLRVKGAARQPVLTMPTRGSLREARAFLDRHTGWLAREMARLPDVTPIVDGAVIPFRGIPHRIRHMAQTRGTVTAVDSGCGPELVVAGGAEHIRRRVIDFLRREARRDLEAAVGRYAERLRVTPTAIRLRDTTSRWGSCAPSGELSFSWRLILAPPFILDYLAAHEVTHLREMNHSQRFWRLLDAVSPDTERARRWLRREGAALHAVGG